HFGCTYKIIYKVILSWLATRKTIEKMTSSSATRAKEGSDEPKVWKSGFHMADTPKILSDTLRKYFTVHYFFGFTFRVDLSIVFIRFIFIVIVGKIFYPFAGK